MYCCKAGFICVGLALFGAAWAAVSGGASWRHSVALESQGRQAGQWLPSLHLAPETIMTRQDSAKGYIAMASANTAVDSNASGSAPGPETPDIEDGPTAETLTQVGWNMRVGDAPGLWVSVSDQRLYVIENGQVRWRTTCSTALNGVGSLANSYKTPPGWHKVVRKIGDNEPWGRVFRARGATAQVWQPGDDTEEDLVLTRIFILDGLEPGINKGRDAQGRVVDSRERYIYIHGTNDETRLGQPVSQGCVRVSNEAAIALYDFIPVGTLLYIDP